MIEDCLATGSQKIGIFAASTCSSAFINNVVTKNNVGIELDEISYNNLVQGNKVFNNSASFSVAACDSPCINPGFTPGAGIIDAIPIPVPLVNFKNNQIYYNTAFQNDVNYAGYAALLPQNIRSRSASSSVLKILMVQQ